MPFLHFSLRSVWAALSTASMALSLVISYGFADATADDIHLTSIETKPVKSGVNLLPNADFQKLDAKGFPVGWSWNRGRTDAACSIDPLQSRAGRPTMRLTNGTEFGPNVFGSFYCKRPIRLTEGKTYTMSVWIKSTSPGIINLVGGRHWQIRIGVTTTSDDCWHRIHKTFQPTAEDCDFTLRLNTESPTPGVWLAGLKVEEGDEPTPDAIATDAGRPPLLDVDDAIECQSDGPFDVPLLLTCFRDMDADVEASLPSGETVKQPLHLAAGVQRILLHGKANGVSDAPHIISVRLKNSDQAQTLAAADAKVRFYSPSSALKRDADVRAALPSLRVKLEKLKSQGQDVSYPTIKFTVLENFVNYVEEDARHNEVRRSIEQIGELETMASQLGRELDEALAGRRHFAAVPRWTGVSRPIVHHSSFVGTVQMPDGTIAERPIFFTGFGHFGQVVADMEKWPGYGTNIIQIELGPSRVMPADGKIDRKPLEEMKRILDRAQKSHVAICLLISPHYFPNWAMKKWPELHKRRDGFLKYCLHAPEGQELLKRFVTETISPLKDHPALHSICISNEPVNKEEPCDWAKKQWHAWLEKRHGDIATLNGRYGANYASFDDVPLPDPFGKRPATPLWMDYIRFNQEFFAGWHQMLADAVHRVAPGLPVHAKAMNWTMLHDTDVVFGVDAYLFSRFSDINGNDAANWYGFGKITDFAQHWQTNAMGNDLQRSMRDAPVFNTENHVIVDRDPRYVPPSHIRAALWQAAVHGQSATTVWVWQRTFDPKSDIADSIMHRPACAAAVGELNCDLNRAALEMTAIQQSKPQALLLQSVSAMVWEGSQYTRISEQAYTALSFTGLTLGFASERQLEAGKTPDAPVLFVPGVVHLSDAAFAALKKFKGRIVLVGSTDLLSRNEYGQPRTEKLTAERFSLDQPKQRDRWAAILPKLADWGLRPAVELHDAAGKPVWGVEWRMGETPDGTVVNLCNSLKSPVSFSLQRGEKNAASVDVLTGERIVGPMTLQPLEVRIVRMEGR